MHNWHTIKKDEYFKEDSVPLIIGFVLLVVTFLMELLSNYGITEKHIFGLFALIITT